MTTRKNDGDERGNGFRSLGQVAEKLDLFDGASPPTPLPPLPTHSKHSAAHWRFVERAVAIGEQDVIDADALGFSARVLVQASLPHRNPRRAGPVWIRRNGNFALHVQPGYTNDGKSIGYPFGNIPRLILTYLTTQVIQNKNREVDLGRSLSSFMDAIGIESNGLHIRRLKDQMKRLFSASISFTVENGAVYAQEKRPVARRVVLWWDDKRPEQQVLFKSSVLLDEEFYKEILEHPVPVDMRAIAALKQSSLALDLYTWLTHRVTWVEKPQRIAWATLQQQMGSEYATTKDFVKNVKPALGKVKAVWPELRLDYQTGGFLISPTRPHVLPAKARKLIR